MLQATHLIGFGAARVGGVETLVDRTTGTNIGNMTLGGDLAAAFDGNTSHTHAAGALLGGTGYVGKSYVTGKRITKIFTHSSSNLGWTDNGAGTYSGNVTLSLYAKNGSPSSSTDGTLLGSETFVDTNGSTQTRTIMSNDTTTTYTHVWLRISGSENTYCAELAIYELI